MLCALLGSARAADLPPLEASFRIWAAPEGSRLRSSSPFAPAADLAGLGKERGRGEAELRLRLGALAADLSARSIAREGRPLFTAGVVNELFYEPELLGEHFTIGKKVVGWDVGFGFRPLDLVQQEDRRALHPFALEGIPLVAWEHFGESWASALVWANPLRGPAPLARDDQSGALRLYRRLGQIDLHLAARYSRRTALQAGAALAAVLADPLEVHGSFRWQRRSERLLDPLPAGSGPPLAPANPLTRSVSRDVAAALAGFTLTPGWDLSLLAEAWLDPAGGTPAEWRDLAAVAERQRALLSDPNVPAAAVRGNLAWGLGAFDRPNLLRDNLLLHLSWKPGRFEPALDLLYTPRDRGWVATAAAAWQGEPVRIEGGLRSCGGPPGAAYRLLPEWAMFYLAGQASF